MKPSFYLATVSLFLVLLGVTYAHAGLDRSTLSEARGKAPFPHVMKENFSDMSISKPAASPKKYRDDELLVKFKTGAMEKGKNNLHKKHGATKIKEFTSLRLHLVKLKKGMSIEDAVKLYQADPAVEYAEPNLLYQALATPNDPQYGQLWGMEKISAPAAWDSTTGNDTVVVAVIDTGIDYTHPDLDGNVWSNSAEIAGNGLDDDANGYADDRHGINSILGSGNPMDDYGHGTHVAGTIGAVGNNGVGVVGVNWNVKIIACKFLDANGSGSTSDAVECLQYIKSLKDRGVNVVATNNSWGCNGSYCYSQALYDAINAQRDILFIAAAGNDYDNDNDKRATYPASYNLPNVLSIAATDANDQKPPFSNKGRRSVHASAPGVAIYSTLPGTNAFGISGGYGILSGTSMATPHVTGLAALLKSQNLNRDWREIRNLILSGGDYVASMDQKTVTGKRIDAYGSLTCQDVPVFSVLQYPATVTVGSPAYLSALSINCGSPSGSVTAMTASGTVISLYDDGVFPDLAAGDGVFTGTWIPSRTGERLTFSSPAGAEAIPVPALVITRYLPEGNTHRYYSQFFEAQGGLPPYTWTLPALQDLPPGLAFNGDTGEISGNPTTTGAFTFTVEVRDALGSVRAMALSIKVSDDSVVEEWARIYDGGSDDFLYGMTVDKTGNVFVTGASYNTENASYSTLTIKYDSSGNMKWKRTFNQPSDTSFGITVDGQDNIYVVGRSVIDWKMLILKYDQAGNLLMSKIDDSGTYASAWEVATDSSNNVFVLGQQTSDYSTVVLKYDPLGNLLWAKPITGWSNPYFAGIAVGSNGNFYVTGQSSGDYTTSKMLTIKYDSSGNQLWTRTSDQGGYAFVAIDGDDNVYVAGTSWASTGMNHYLAFKYDSSGNLLWTRTYDNGSPDSVNGAVVDGSGNLYLTGYCYGAMSTDLLTVKYDSSGDFIWAKILGARLEGYRYGETDEFAEAIAADDNGNLYVAGWAVNEAGSDFLTVKYGQLSQFTPPIATINGTPASPTNAVSAALTVGGTGVVAYKYRLDSGIYSAETAVGTLINLTSLSEGTHTVTAIGKDSAGIWQVTPTTASWTVDLTPPSAAVSGAQLNGTSAILMVGGTDVIAYKYALDGGAYSAEIPVANKIRASGLNEGVHAVSVIGRDSADNWQTTPTTMNWTVDSWPVSVPLAGNFRSIMEAYNALLSDNIIQVKGMGLVEDLVFNHDINIILLGGYDPATGTSSGTTILYGSLTIDDGAVSVENLSISPP